ncbi:MAG: hypothetical protein ACFFCX_10505 [Candidatus Sifarchaeia archaeon]
MPSPDELERLGSLFNLASEKNRPFLEKCSETKYLAVRDYDRATSIIVELMKQTLCEANSGLTEHNDCKKYIVKLKQVVESGQLDRDIIHALEKLRSKYLKKVLSPAVRMYFSNRNHNTSEIEALYNDALRIDGLLEAIQFLKKVEPVT